jgi:hypothetical protein
MNVLLQSLTDGVYWLKHTMAAAYVDDRYLNKDESDFVDLVSSDVAYFLDQAHGDSNRLRCFMLKCIKMKY